MIPVQLSPGSPNADLPFSSGLLSSPVSSLGHCLAPTVSFSQISNYTHSQDARNTHPPHTDPGIETQGTEASTAQTTTHTTRKNTEPTKTRPRHQTTEKERHVMTQGNAQRGGERQSASTCAPVPVATTANHFFFFFFFFSYCYSTKTPSRAWKPTVLNV